MGSVASTESGNEASSPFSRPGPPVPARKRMFFSTTSTLRPDPLKLDHATFTAARPFQTDAARAAALRHRGEVQDVFVELFDLEVKFALVGIPKHGDETIAPFHTRLRVGGDLPGQRGHQQQQMRLPHAGSFNKNNMRGLG